MKGYLGEFPVACDLTPEEGSMLWIERYGQIDGAHHKAWVLDQVARILQGTPINMVEARWDNGYTELRPNLGEPSKEYLEWVTYMRGKWDEEYGEYEYSYNDGIAP